MAGSSAAPITGGYVYRGPEDGLHGAYLFADFVSGRVFSLARDAAGAPAVAERTGQLAFVAGGALNSPVSFGEDAEGRLYVVDIDGEVFRLTPRALAADLGDRLEGGEGDGSPLRRRGRRCGVGRRRGGPTVRHGGRRRAGRRSRCRSPLGRPGQRPRSPAARMRTGSAASDGTDTLVLSGARADYDVSLTAGGISTVADRRAGGDGADQVSAVEVLRFADGWLALDGRTPLGSALRLYEAALGREPDPIGLGFWTGALEAGRITLAEAARSFVASPEFQARYGAPDNAGFVDLLYRNALGRAADADGLAYWTGCARFRCDHPGGGGARLLGVGRTGRGHCGTLRRRGLRARPGRRRLGVHLTCLRGAPPRLHGLFCPTRPEPTPIPSGSGVLSTHSLPGAGNASQRSTANLVPRAPRKGGRHVEQASDRPDPKASAAHPTAPGNDPGGLPAHAGPPRGLRAGDRRAGPSRGHLHRTRCRLPRPRGGPRRRPDHLGEGDDDRGRHRVAARHGPGSVAAHAGRPLPPRPDSFAEDGWWASSPTPTSAARSTPAWSTRPSCSRRSAEGVAGAHQSRNARRVELRSGAQK